MQQVVKDARWRRSRARLELAVVELAAERDITQSSVLELTRRAGVSRRTFYAHANTPVDLLIQILSRELSKILEDGLAEIERRGSHQTDISDQVVYAIVDHVLERKAVYAALEHRSNRYALRSVLVPLMQASIQKFFNRNLVRLPKTSARDKRGYAAFLTGGVVGAIEDWIELGSRRRRRDLLDTINACYPEWFLKPKKPRAKKRPVKKGRS